MTIRELLEADPCVVALDITIRKDKRFVKDYLIGAHVTNGSYYEELGKNEKWTQYNRGYGSYKFRRAISFRPINYQDVEGGSSCGCILKNIPKRILDLPIDSLKPSRVMYSSQAYHNWSEFHGYYIDSPIEDDWKDLPEEKITRDLEEDPEEEYLTDEDLLKPKEENISFDDLLGGEND